MDVLITVTARINLEGEEPSAFLGGLRERFDAVLSDGVLTGNTAATLSGPLAAGGADLRVQSLSLSATPELVVDGTAEDGTLQGDGELAPFVVFNVDDQRNLPGEYPTRAAAESAMAKHHDQFKPALA